MKKRVRRGSWLAGLLILAGCTATESTTKSGGDVRETGAATATEPAADLEATVDSDPALLPAEEQPAGPEETTLAQAPEAKPGSSKKDAKQPKGKRMALLVGCSDYDNPDVSDLVGPANDVVLMRQLLVNFYDFKNEDIQTLANAEADDKQPTRANILAALEEIIKKAGKGDQVVVHFSGHGTQQPDSDFDPQNDPEPDGLDEVFVPKDCGGWDPATGKLVNAVVDDEFRDIIARLTNKGADLWTIFDCCCSGTIGREVKNVTNPEVKREVLPGDLNIPQEALEKARQRAREAYANVRDLNRRSDSLDAVRGAADAGGFVATYAARPFEPTIEMYFPLDAVYEADQKSYGLLTYAINKILSEAQTNLTYTELQDRIQQQYSAWDRAYPICLVEGEHRDQLILDQDGGERVTRILLEKDADGTLAVDAGAIQGLTAGSILRLKPKAGVADEPIGCVKVVGLQALRATVEPAAFESEPAADPAALETGCRAEIALLDLGLKKKRVAFATDEDSSLAAKTAGPALANIGASSMFEFTENPQDADWLVRVQGDQAFLQHGGSLVLDRDGQRGGPSLHAFGPAPAGGASLASWIQSSMQRIARAEGLLGMSGSSDSLMGGEDPVRINVRLIQYPSETSRGEAVRGDPTFRPGDWIGFQVENYGRDSVDVTILYVDSGYGITAVFPDSKRTTFNNVIDPGTEYTTPAQQISSDTFGLERVVVIAVKSQGKPAEFTWLEQDTIEQATLERGGAKHPLDQLLESAAYGAGGERGLTKSTAQTCAIRSLPLTVEE